MRPDLMPDAVTYTRFQLSAIELTLVLVLAGLACLWYWLPRINGSMDLAYAAERARDRQAGRAAGYVNLTMRNSDFFDQSSAWRHGYVEGRAAKAAGKPLDYLNEVPSAIEPGETNADS